MKKKLEAELISIAHRILKLKNRDELDVLQQETLKLYEKISVLRFVEDNFNDVKPTIGYASAEETLEEIYGIEETPVVHANEQEAEEDEKKAQAKSEEKPQAEEPKEDKPQATSEEHEESDDSDQSSEEAESGEPENGEGVTAGSTPEEDVSEEEKEETEESGEQGYVEEGYVEEDYVKTTKSDDTRNPQPETEESETISAQPEIEKSDEDVKAMEEGAAAVYKKEDDASPEEEEQAADAEVITIEPDSNAKVEDMGVNFEFAFERKPAPDEPQKQKEITFEDYKDYKEPEFVKKGDEVNEPQGTSQQPQAEEEKPTATSQEPQEETRDWRDWEPTNDEPKAEEKPQAQPETANNKPQTGNSRALTLGLNDRIAFEKNLFGGSGEDLNRVISQLNTFDSLDEAKEFIADMVKPDYNNWQGKEEYEERFMALVEKKFD